ncbi:MAG: ATP-binding protein [Pseudomonadota bacterium]|nr:ATP-binding protein [Pseudomonadota bacterium]
MSSAPTPSTSSEIPPAPAVAGHEVPWLTHWLTGERLRWVVIIFSVLALALAWGVILVELGGKRQDAIKAEVRQNANLALVLQEQTMRVLAAVDQATLRLRDSVRNGSFRPEDYARFANETGLVPDILTQLSYVGADGRFIGSNIDPGGDKTGHVDLSEREHIRAHLQPELAQAAAGQMSTNGLFIGKPVLGKVSGKWTIQLTRKITAPDGQTRGVVVASLNPSYFEQVYRQVRLGEQGVVSLIGDDRSVRARVVGGESKGLGVVLAPNSYIGTSAVPDEGFNIRASAVDGVERIVAHRRVGSYPLLVLVATTTEVALSEWRSTRTVALVLTTLFSMAVIGAAVLFLAGVRQLEAKNRSLQISEAQAQAANQAKSEFLAAISHELRTPLTSIRGFSELMERRLEEPKYREQAGMIRKAAEHLNTLLTEILDLSKVEAGAMPLHPEPQVLAELLQSSADFFAVSAAEKRLTLSVRIAPDAPPTLVCDGLRFKQILNNLLSNAMKFTSEGCVTIELGATADQVRVHVVDTGPGIPAELHETIFEKFRQGNARVSYEHGGTGLGLALSRALAQRMGGTLTVTSEVGKGARFTLSLPRR